jgi:hypothetical protein
MSTLPPFDRGKPFYPLVINHVAGLHGWQNLFARAIGRTSRNLGDEVLRELEESGDVSLPVSGPAPLRELRDAANLPATIWPLMLSCRTQEDSIDIDHDALADAMFPLVSLSPELFRAAEHLLVLAWETTKRFHTRDPLWQFLRHCRNAGAHGGRFHLAKGEPKYPASFRGLEFTRDLEGTRLFGRPEPTDVDQRGLLHIGDPIALLWDIEQAYPAMTV